VADRITRRRVAGFTWRRVAGFTWNRGRIHLDSVARADRRRRKARLERHRRAPVAHRTVASNPVCSNCLNQIALVADGLGSFELQAASITPIDTKPICPLDCCPTNGLE
jgi:hypothetical protein